MGFHHANNHVFAAAAAAYAFAEHLVRLAHAWSVAKKQLKNRRPPDGSNFLKPLVWSLGHTLCTAPRDIVT
jgi:hypothetical protein